MKKLLVSLMLILSSLSVFSMSVEEIQKQIFQETTKLNELINLKQQESLQKEEQVRRNALEQEFCEDISALVAKSMGDVARTASFLQRIAKLQEDYLSKLKKGSNSSRNVQNSDQVQPKTTQERGFQKILAQVMLPVVGDLVNHLKPLAIEACTSMICSHLSSISKTYFNTPTLPSTAQSSSNSILPSAGQSSSELLLSYWL